MPKKVRSRIGAMVRAHPTAMRKHWLLRLLVLGLPACASQAADFRVGELDGLFDVTLSYGLGVRTVGTDERLVAIANGGGATSANADDGTLNYNRGLVSNALRVNADLTLSWQQLGAYVRGYAFYDHENQDVGRVRTPLSDGAKDIAGRGSELLDHYISLRAAPWGVPLLFRLGDQVVNWGETNFVRNGLDVVNPFDLTALNQPATPARDLLTPQGMLWGAANVTETLAVEAYYQYEWQPVRIPPVGTFFSTGDLLGSGGLNFAMLGGGRFSDQGTDLDAAFGLPAGTLGFDADFFKLPGLAVKEPRDGGQFGILVSTILPGTNAAKISAQLIRYHSRLPIVSGRTAGQAAVERTTPAAVERLADSLAPAYETEGLSPDQATETAAATAAALATSNYANQAGFLVEYPEDIGMIGIGFNTATLRRGILVSGEIAHHWDYPLQVSIPEVFAAVLSPVQLDGNGETSLGAYGADQGVPGSIRRDRTQAAFGVTKLLGPRLGASQTTVSADLAWAHIHNMPDSDTLALHAVGEPSADSWGYRLSGALSYQGVLGGLGLRPRFLWTHDVRGITPAPLSTFVEGRKSLTVGLGLRYIDRWTADLSYTSFSGAGALNLLRDRDLLRLRVSYSY